MNTYPSSIVRAGTEALIGGGYGKRIWSVGELLWGIEELVILSNQHESIIGIGEGETLEMGLERVIFVSFWFENW